MAVEAVPLVYGARRTPFFKEFTLERPKSPERVVKRLRKERILAAVTA